MMGAAWSCEVHADGAGLRSKTEPPSIDVDLKADLEKVCRQLLCPEWLPPNLSSYLHLCSLGGSVAQLGVDISPVPQLAALLDSDCAKPLLRLDVLVRTRSGLRFATNHFIPGLRLQGAEFHRDQVLLELLRNGYGPTTPVVAAGGLRGTLGEVIADLLANTLDLPEELPWSAAVLARVVPPKRGFHDKTGRWHSLDEVADALLGLDLSSQSCGGLHVLDAMAEMCEFGAAAGALSQSRVAALQQRLSEHAKALMASQFANGAWDTRWHFRGARSAASPSDSNNDQELIATGHVCELSIRHPSIRLPGHVFNAGVRRCCELVKALARTGSSESLRRQVCPITHVVNAIARSGAMAKDTR